MKIKNANRIAPDGTPHFSASHLGLLSLPMSHKKEARLIRVNDLLMPRLTCVSNVRSSHFDVFFHIPARPHLLIRVSFLPGKPQEGSHGVGPRAQYKNKGGSFGHVSV